MKTNNAPAGDEWHFARLATMPLATYEQAHDYMRICGARRRNTAQLLLQAIAAGAITRLPHNRFIGNLVWRAPKLPRHHSTFKGFKPHLKLAK